MPEDDVEEISQLASDKIIIEIESPDKCPRYTARIVNDVEVKPSPYWVQERLRNLDVRPISNVVDVTNYVLLELGHPLHAFDYHLVNDARIIVRTAEEGERFITLDEKEHRLEASDLLIADPQRGIALAGVMGGLNTEIQDDTKDVLLECAYFDPVGIRTTSRDRGISSESSYRFERGVDPEMTIYAVNRAAYLIKEFAGGKALKGVVDNYPKPWQSSIVKLRPARVNRLLSTDIPAEDMTEFLKRLGCKIKDGEIIEAIPPSWRHDLEREVDLIEEVARLYGYDNVEAASKSSLPLVFYDETERMRRLTVRFKQSLVELGFREAISPSLVTSFDAKGLSGRDEPVKLVNPLSADMTHLRSSLAVSLMKATARTFNAGIYDVRLFEWGKCFRMIDNTIAEGNRLAGLMTGSIRPDSWLDKSHSITIYDLKGLIEQFATKISLDKLLFNPYDIAGLTDGCKISVAAEDNTQAIEIGEFGQIDPAICEIYNLDMAAWYFELDGDKLLKLTSGIQRYKPLSRYPAALRDLAFIVDLNLNAGDLGQIIKKRGGKYLEKLELFDLFSGKGIPAGKKSLAFHLIFRSAEGTLSEEVIDRSIKKIIDAASHEIGAKLRSS